jgi:hypothetical protein
MAEPGLGEGASDAWRWLGDCACSGTNRAAGVRVTTSLSVTIDTLSQVALVNRSLHTVIAARAENDRRLAYLTGSSRSTRYTRR